MTTFNLQLLNQTIDQHQDTLFEIQQHLHQYPELSNQEFDTTAYLAKTLSNLGLSPIVRPSKVGLYVDIIPDPLLNKGSGLEYIAIRADIDALPIEEPTDKVTYYSRHQGVMHACGHDLHTACAMGAVMALKQEAHQLKKPIRVIFQHSEELTANGAFEFVEEGVLDPVSAILGLHIDPSRDLGTIGVCEGPFTASYDAFKITVKGRSAHGARPYEGVDTIFVLTKVAQSLYEIFGRFLDSQDPSVISIGKIYAGKAPNAIPGHGELEGTVRTLSATQREKAETLIRRTVNGIAETFLATADIFWEKGSPPVVNDAHCTQVIQKVAQQLLAPDAIKTIARPSMGSEDFAHYLKDRPGAMFRLGVIGKTETYDHLHSETMVANPKAILFGAKILAGAAALLSLES